MTADPRPKTGLPYDDSALEAATDWLFRLQAAPEDAALRLEHARWLAAADSHVGAWLDVQRSWRVTGQLKPQAASAQALPLRPRLRPLSVRPVRMMAVALAACLLIVALAPVLVLHWRAEQVTSAGENRALTLEDGSVVTLGGDSAFAMAFMPDQRRVSLLHGEAHFQVTVDAARPFVIAAGPVTVTVVGTALDVSMDERSIGVAVASGRVQVQPGAADGGPLTLVPGDRIAIDRQSGAAVLARLAPEDVGAWRERRLVLHDLPLPDAMARLDRYHRGEILVLPGVDGEALARQRVSGIFDLDDPVRALRGMLAAGSAELRQLQVREITPYVIVLTQ